MIHCGDGDRTFPELVRRLNVGESVADLPGLMYRREGEIVSTGRAPNLEDLDETPVPDFDEYFHARKESGYEDWSDAERPLLPVETSRGCWWGMKSQCSFCGLNRAGLSFRAQSPKKVIQTLGALAAKHRCFHFNAIDNIMAPEYVDDLFGRLEAERCDLQLHYEVHPTLGREQLGRLKRGGLFSIQPGIESLSTHLLKLMGKGTTAMRNLELIKWCTYFGINNLYNILLGFPGELEQDYSRQCELIHLIHHLQPPYTITRARADRGSPMFTRPDQWSIGARSPAWCYTQIFPTDRFDLARVSYYFDHELGDVLGDAEYDGIFAAVADWKARHGRAPGPSLEYRKAGETIFIDDRRGEFLEQTTCSGREAQLYEACADARHRRELNEQFEGDEGWLDRALDELVERRLMVRVDNRYLSLALPVNPAF